MAEATGERPSRVLIVCNGDPPSETLLAREEVGADFVIYTDGAAARLLSEGRRADLVIGDFDSARGLPPGIPTLDAGPHEAQANSDSEKALLHALAVAASRGCARPVVRLLGATGSRLDHSLANIQLLARYAGEAEIALLDDRHEIRALRGAAELAHPVGTTVSLLALTEPCRIRTEGLVWEVDGPLVLGSGGISNRVARSPARIEALEGCLLTMVLRDEALVH